MTPAQSFKIYEILQKHFNNSDDAKTVVQEIEQIVEIKVEAKKDVLSTKEDLLNTKLALKEDLLNTKQDLIDRIHRAKIETIIWIVGIGILQFIGSILAKRFM